MKEAQCKGTVPPTPCVETDAGVWWSVLTLVLIRSQSISPFVDFCEVFLAGVLQSLRQRVRLAVTAVSVLCIAEKGGY